MPDGRAPIAIRALTHADTATCTAIAHAIGWKSDEATWRTLLGVGDGYGVEVDGALVGTVIVHRFGDALATISMMTMRPEHQRRGLATRLMERALAGVPRHVVALYATDAGRPVYQRLGFVDVGSSARIEGRARATRAREALRPMRPSDLPAAIALDARAQGAPRTALLNALFHDSTRSMLRERGGSMTGFGLARTVAGSHVVGPVVAESDDDACAIADALSAESELDVRIDLEPGEEALLGWAREAGLAHVHGTPRMVLRGEKLPGDRRMVRTLAARAFG